MTALVDTHCHLAHLDGSPEDAIARAQAAGVVWLVDIGMGTSESAAAAARAGTLDGVYASVGIHPNDLAEFERDAARTMDAIGELATHPGVVAVGETGLDRYRDRSSPELQEAAFRAHIALAREVGRALVIHCRDAHTRVLEVLDEEGAPERVVMHCFSGDVDHARACVARGFFCSFAGNVTYPKADGLRDAARVIPAELLLAETDAPYLAPQAVRGKTNAPEHVVHTVRTLADTRAADFDELAAALVRNAQAAFRIG